VTPKSVNQLKKLNAIEQCDMVFGIGQAGIGKTCLAVAQAVTSLLAKRVKCIILTRLAVEAGEEVGFLSGDVQGKVNLFLGPLYDMLDMDRVDRLFERDVIEIAPIAFMREQP
jgi:phosphate starvation-inducible PhoH-like protein